MENSSVHPSAGPFPTTCWSNVARAGDPDNPATRDGLAALCAAYWFPLYCFIRRKGHNAEVALDLTQEYFARFLEKGILGSADRHKGRFRSFLFADCNHFLAHYHDHNAAQKRGGGRTPISIDARDAEGRYRAEPSHNVTAEQLFARDWALTLLADVLNRLRCEYEASGRSRIFEALKEVLSDGSPRAPHAELAAAIGSTPRAVQVAVHRLRKRYRELIREVILTTVADPGDVEAEIRDLFVALGGPF